MSEVSIFPIDDVGRGKEKIVERIWRNIVSEKVEWAMRIGIDPITNSSFQQIINTRSMNVKTSFIRKWQIVDLCSTMYMNYSGNERPVVGEIYWTSPSGSRKALFNWLHTMAGILIKYFSISSQNSVISLFNMHFWLRCENNCTSISSS